MDDLKLTEGSKHLKEDVDIKDIQRIFKDNNKIVNSFFKSVSKFLKETHG